MRPYIDLIDNLRHLGLEKDVALPSIVVVGDQSAGKSSTLEAISGIQLPRGSGRCYTCHSRYLVVAKIFKTFLEHRSLLKNIIWLHLEFLSEDPFIIKETVHCTCKQSASPTVGGGLPSEEVITNNSQHFHSIKIS